jgi:hypothetical protein
MESLDYRKFNFMIGWMDFVKNREDQLFFHWNKLTLSFLIAPYCPKKDFYTHLSKTDADVCAVDKQHQK